MTKFAARLPALALAPVVAFALPLAGCISFGAEPPDTLLTLNADTPVPTGSTRTGTTGRAIVVTTPTAPAAIAVQRVPVETTPTSLAYVKEAQWVEPPARLFGRLMSDTIAARTGRIAVTQAQAIGERNDQLDGELRRFDIDGVRREAVVAFEAALSRSGQPSTEKRRFEARVPVSAIDAASVGPALSQAANQVAREVADWVGR